jgi:hypothetical protein
LAMIVPLAEPLAGYFRFFGLKGGLLIRLVWPVAADGDPMPIAPVGVVIP